MKTKDVLARVLPQFFPAHWLDAPGIVYTDFPSRIRIGYILQGDGNYSYISEHDFVRFRISLKRLHEAALANLEHFPPANISIAKVPGAPEGWISTEDDNFAAVRILLPSYQKVFCKEIGTKFLVTVPCRDDCFCWSLLQPPKRQEKHAEEAKEAFLQDEYNLTPDVLLFSDGGFRLYREQSVEG